MNKIWQVVPKMREDFVKKYPEYSRVLLQLLYNRDIRSKEDIDYFLKADFKDSYDPYLFKDMEETVDLIIHHVKEQNKICIYGDYDADGITSSVILYETLETLKAECLIYLPDRVKEGYGLNMKAIDKVKKKGAKLIITVDGGIRSKEEVEYAKKIGLDIIITDHHTPSENREDLPQCLIINPIVPGEKYPFKYLAGVGVAFKVASAIIDKAKLTKEHKERLKTRVLDVVAIGTVADCVTLFGENRVLVKEGLKFLNNSRRLGLRELMKIAGIENKKLEAWNIGFQIGPRLNASSRMGSAGSEFELLITKDKEEARLGAETLNNKNIKRQKETEKMVAEVEEQIQEQLDEKIIIGICPDDSKWNEGIIGLVAGKVSEKYYKPSLIFARTEDGYKASGRSIEEFNLFEAMEESTELLGKHGGHPMACGLSIETKNLQKFAEKVRKIAKRELDGKDLRPKLKIDCELEIKEVDKKLVREINKVAPFGQHNRQPIFLSKKIQIKDIVMIGKEGQHVKVRFNSLWGLGFGKSEEWKDLRIGDFVDVVYNLDINEFNGKSDVQLKIIDLRLHE